MNGFVKGNHVRPVLSRSSGDAVGAQDRCHDFRHAIRNPAPLQPSLHIFVPRGSRHVGGIVVLPEAVGSRRKIRQQLGFMVTPWPFGLRLRCWTQGQVMGDALTIAPVRKVAGTHVGLARVYTLKLVVFQHDGF